MPQTLFIRAPFQPVDGSTASDYQLVDNFITTGRLTVNVAADNPARLGLQPVFPGTITFKPAAGAVIPSDPSAADAPAVTGDLFLELSVAGQRELRTAASHFGYAPVFAYFGVTLGSTFFNQTVIDPLRLANGQFKLVREGGKRLTTAAQIGNAFARGALSVAVSPGQTALNCVFPMLAASTGSTTASVTLMLGVRPQWNPYFRVPPLAALSSSQIVAAPDFVPIPISYVYRMLSHLPGWQTLAADGHAAHAFLAALKATETPDGAPPPPAVRWRRLRVFPPGPRTATPSAHIAFDGITASAGPVGGGAPLWTAPLNWLGEVFVQRPDGEAFRLELRDPDGNVVELRKEVDGTDADFLDLTWDTPNGDTEPALNDITAAAQAPDPLALPFQAIPYGAYDQAGLTFAAQGNTIQVVARRALVGALQQLLHSLGFLIAGNDRKFGRPLAWALREFQIYAAMSRVARETGSAVNYSDRLTQFDNPALYTGSVNGIFDEATATALRVWRDNGLRCPVVAESWTINQGQRQAIVVQNLWSPADDPVREHRVYVRDLTGHYTIPANHADDDRFLIGRYETFGTHQGVVSTVLSHTSWTPDTLVTPEHLVGRTLPANPPAADQAAVSTYKVIGAVSVAEAEHVFDSLNGYDRAVMSMGVFHWTVFLAEGSAELPAYLALLRTATPDDYERFFGRFGIRPAGTWPPLNGNAQNPMFIDGEKKWATRVQQRGLLLDNAIDVEWRSLERIEDANYLRTWHWFYRWVMANRTSTVTQRRQYYLGRLRLRAVLDAEWGRHPGFPEFDSIGQVFSSERMVAALLRAQVNAPGSVIRNGRASAFLREAYLNAGLTNNDPSSWTQANMLALQTALENRLRAYNPSIRDTLQLATQFEDATFGALDTSRNSFVLDTTDLP